MIRLALVLLAVSAASAQPAREWEAREVEGFVDGLMEAQKTATHFAGAVVVIVRDGQVSFEKGYGYADFAARQPVDPKHTLFRVASNSKMFVWTSVMQLVEEGKLALHADVNKYLRGMQIPPTFAEPVTLEHLMTHTAGFEDKIIGLFAKTPDRLRPLGDLMKTDMPRRIFPPGKVTAYSNYGTSLAALIVEQVAGAPYEEYVRTRILDPLGMKYATLTQPVPKDIAPNLSKGYRWTGDRLKEETFEYVPWAPCGAMSISGEDMGRFMMAHLNDGALGAARIVRPETARAMREKLTSFSPRINGMLHGFMEMNWNGETILGHGGDTIWFHSLTAMLPARHLGIFVAYNTDSGAPARDQFSSVFLDHYFPRPLAQEPPPPKERASLERFSGTYSTARVSESDVTKFAKLAAAVPVNVDSDGYLVTNQNKRWRQVEPLVFAEVDGKRELVFRQDEHGQVVDACSSPICVAAIQKQPWWNSRGLQFTWIGICGAILACALIGLPIAAVRQRHQANPAGSKLARLTAWLASVTFLAGAAMVWTGLRDPDEIVFAAPPAMRAGLTMWMLGLVLSIGLVVFTVSAWQRKWWRAAGRVSLTLVCLATLGAALWLHHWNLLGWKY
ncbi:MAG TPA: serine hydrolase domain-containing protein [Bryobacteraceae bacterium]|nr:serine hydrolase domain-containing protein [Bryobacteraceae bacterium]